MQSAKCSAKRKTRRLSGKAISGLTVITALLATSGVAQADSEDCQYYPQYCQRDYESLQVYNSVVARAALDYNALVSQIIGARKNQARNRTTSSSSRGTAGAAGGERWSVWGAAARGNMAQSFLNASGHTNVALGGVDYTLNNDVIFGVAATLERSKTTSFGTRIEGDGYSLAPYVAIPLNANWLFDASLGYGRSDIDSITGAFVASAKDRRSFGSASLTYSTEIGKWQLQGKTIYLASKDKFNTTPSTTSDLNQLRVGGQVTYDAGNMLPYLAVTAIRDVRTPPTIFGSANDRHAVQVQAGVNIYSNGPLSGGVSYSHEAYRKEVKNNVLVANLSYRF